MSRSEATVSTSERTIAPARATHAEDAIATTFDPNRFEQPRAAAQCSAMARWTAENRRSATKRRGLGEMTRGEREAA